MKTTGRKRGRKKTGYPLRETRVVCSMTPQDTQWLDQFALDSGFDSRSQLVTCILERLILCGFSPAGTARFAAQIQHRLIERQKSGKNRRQAKFDFDSLLLRPLPALPEEAPTSETAEAEALPELQHEHEHA